MMNTVKYSLTSDTASCRRSSGAETALAVLHGFISERQPEVLKVRRVRPTCRRAHQFDARCTGGCALRRLCERS
jgi:hypothetical protein